MTYTPFKIPSCSEIPRIDWEQLWLKMLGTHLTCGHSGSNTFKGCEVGPGQSEGFAEAGSFVLISVLDQTLGKSWVSAVAQLLSSLGHLQVSSCPTIPSASCCGEGIALWVEMTSEKGCSFLGSFVCTELLCGPPGFCCPLWSSLGENSECRADIGLTS